jgi:hypothetical protein
VLTPGLMSTGTSQRAGQTWRSVCCRSKLRSANPTRNAVARYQRQTASGTLGHHRDLLASLSPHPAATLFLPASDSLARSVSLHLIVCV